MTLELVATMEVLSDAELCCLRVTIRAGSEAHCLWGDGRHAAKVSFSHNIMLAVGVLLNDCSFTGGVTSRVRSCWQTQ
jgi:hypothetical protein